MTTKPRFLSPHVMAVALTAGLAMIYGIVPANPEFFRLPPWPEFMIAQNSMGAAILVVIIAGVGYLSRGMVVTRQPVPIHPWFAAMVFAGGCVWLRIYSWGTVYDGYEGTVSALFRILWFVVIMNLRQTEMPLAKRMIYAVATVILMFFDESRTYFLIALLILLTNLNWIAVALAILAALLVAAVRSDQTYGFMHAITFAVGGEGYLGSQGVFQVLTLAEGGISFWIPAVQAMFAPITALITLAAKRFGYPADLFDSSTYLGNYVQAATGQPYPPMGGFFILSEFIRADWIGLVCMVVYFAMVFFLTKRLFDTVEFPIGSFIAILAVKNSPMTYWNLVISVVMVSYLVRLIGRILRSAGSPSPEIQPGTAS